jgi:DNA-binding CsgD family transcriptional regulator/PAS domain-containing protein
MTTIDDFSRTVQTIYDAAVGPGDWAVALEAISVAMGASVCSLVTSDGEHKQFAFSSAGTDPASMTTYNDYYGALDHLPVAPESMPVGTIATRDQLVPRDVVARSEFYNDWAHPNECGDGVFSVLSRHGDGASWLAIAARAKQDPFGTPERLGLAGALVPHLQQALGTRARLSELDHQYRELASAVDLLTDGIAIVGPAGWVIHLNPAAEAMLGGDDGFSLRAGHLTAAVSRIGGAFDRIVHQALDRGRWTVATGGCVAVPRRSGLRPYLVRVIPLGLGDSGGAGSPSAMVIIVDPERESEPELEALRRVYGLTKTEAEVALRVLDGSGLGPIADELSVSLSTVRTHLQHVFDKTQTHRQAELVRLLLGGLAATRRPETI